MLFADTWVVGVCTYDLIFCHFTICTVLVSMEENCSLSCRVSDCQLDCVWLLFYHVILTETKYQHTCVLSNCFSSTFSVAAKNNKVIQVSQVRPELFIHFTKYCNICDYPSYQKEKKSFNYLMNQLLYGAFENVIFR